MKLPYLRGKVCLFLIGLVVAGWWVGVVASCAAADRLEQLDTSVKLIPADAAFYSSMLRNREVLEIILKSNAWSKLMKLPITQQGLGILRLQADNPQTELGQFLAVMRTPEAKELLALAQDMGSHEIFVYGDESVGDFYQFFQNFYNGVNYKLMLLRFTAPMMGGNIEEMQKRVFVSTALENLDQLVIPDMLFGFKVTDTQTAQKALDKLEKFLNEVFEAEPRLKERLKKETVGDHQYLVLRLDGELIPWEQMPLEELQESGINPSDLRKLKGHIKEMKLVVAVGLRQDYLLLSVGSSLKCLEALGGGKDRLIDRPELKPLEQFADQKLIGISYISQAMYRKLSNTEQSLDNTLHLLMQLLPLAGLTQEQNTRVQKDAKALVADLKSWIPKVGAATEISFLVPQGVESYQYAWGDHSPADGVQPLSLLQHVGGSPILGIVSRSKPSLDQYEIAVKWGKTAWKYIQDFGLARLSEEERKTVEEFVEDVIPLLQRLDRANREMLFPALEDGQSALVLDARFTSRQLYVGWPRMDKPMPLPELALLWGVSDAEKLKQGVGEYYAVLNEFLDVLRKHEPEAIPEGIKLPQPRITEKAGATLYAFPLPKAWGLDKRLMPNAGLTENVAVVALTLHTTERLLKPTPLRMGGVLEDPDKPRILAAWLNWSGLVDAARPWVDYALGELGAAGLNVDVNSALDQAHTVLDILQTFKNMTLEQYPGEGCKVTHSRIKIQDLPDEQTPEKSE
jgi:hypothetical protein